jgi:hypothetical protein
MPLHPLIRTLVMKINLLSSLKYPLKHRTKHRNLPLEKTVKFKDWDLSEATFEGRGKSGKSTWSAHTNGVRVKLYQVDSGATANFIAAVSNEPQDVVLFPKVLDHDDNFVLAEWVVGKTV